MNKSAIWKGGIIPVSWFVHHSFVVNSIPASSGCAGVSSPRFCLERMGALNGRSRFQGSDLGLEDTLNGGWESRGIPGIPPKASEKFRLRIYKFMAQILCFSKLNHHSCQHFVSTRLSRASKRWNESPFASKTLIRHETMINYWLMVLNSGAKKTVEGKVVDPIFLNKVLYIPGGCLGFLNHQQY